MSLLRGAAGRKEMAPCPERALAHHTVFLGIDISMKGFASSGNFIFPCKDYGLMKTAMTGLFGRLLRARQGKRGSLS